MVHLYSIALFFGRVSGTLEVPPSLIFISGMPVKIISSFAIDAIVRSIFQFAKDVTSKVVLNFGMAGDGLAKTCSWVLVPIMPSTGADKNAAHFLNLPN
jgi:hypothetical protein